MERITKNSKHLSEERPADRVCAQQVLYSASRSCLPCETWAGEGKTLCCQHTGFPQPVLLQHRNGWWVLLLQDPGNTDSRGRLKFHFQKSEICLRRATAGRSKPDLPAFQITQACPHLCPTPFRLETCSTAYRLAQPDPEFMYLCTL